ncbi:MAG: prolyl oligopeptidase family serine peptidase [Colwellia sp.]
MRQYLTLLFLVLIATLLFSTTTHAQVPLAAYGNIPNTSLMTISPSGKFIGFRKKSAAKDVYMVFSFEENKIIASVDVGDSKPSKAYFVTDEQIILVVGKYQQTHGYYGSSPQHTTYALGFNLATNKIYRLLIPGNGIYDNQWGLGDISGISSNGEFIYMPAYVGGVLSGQWEGVNKDLMKTRLTGSRKPRSSAKGSEFTQDYFVDNEDNILARVEYDNKEDIFSIQKKVDDDWVNIYQEKRSVPFIIQGITPDKKNLVLGMFTGKSKWSDIHQDKVAITLISDSDSTNTVTPNQTENTSTQSANNTATKLVAYFTMSLADGKIAEEPIFSRDDASVESVITDINRVVYGVKYSGFLPQYEFFDAKLTKRLEKISHSFANTAVHLKDWSNNWDDLLVYIEGQESSGEYVIVNEKNEMNIVGMARPSIPYTSVHPISIFNYQAADGLKIPALLTKPKSWDGKTKLATVMLPHGGPESYDRIGFNWLAQYFAEQGYLVIQPQFRGSKGFGLAHKNAGRGEWGKKMQSDLTDALAAVVKKGYADPERVCIVGASYGGYAALAASVFAPNLYQCIVSINGISDVEMMLAKKKQKYGKDHWALSYWDNVIVNKADKNTLLKEISPINHVANVKAPVLLIHSEHDGTVSFAQSSDMHEALQDNNKDSTLVELDKDDHYLSYTETRLQALTEISKFLKEHLK